MQSIIDRLSVNFLLPAFIPSLAFVFVGLVIFRPIVPQKILDLLPLSVEPLTEGAILVLLLSFLLGFTLSSLNTFIYKVTEGYIFLERVPWWRKRQQLKAKRRKQQIAKLQKIIDQLVEKGYEGEQLEPLLDKLHSMETDYRLNYPPAIRSVLPTRFGNIFRATEYYPNGRYRIDSVILWPRLTYVIPPSYFSKIENGNNGLAFIINCMWLSFALAILCGAAAIYQWISWFLRIKNISSPIYFINLDELPSVYLQRGLLYLLLIGCLLIVGYVFYLAALPVARQYGSLIGSAVDLFRFDLLRQLKLPLPETYSTEKNQWLKLSLFIKGSPDGPLLHGQTYRVTTDDNGE